MRVWFVGFVTCCGTCCSIGIGRLSLIGVRRGVIRVWWFRLIRRGSSTWVSWFPEYIEQFVVFFAFHRWFFVGMSAIWNGVGVRVAFVFPVVGFFTGLRYLWLGWVDRQFRSIFFVRTQRCSFQHSTNGSVWIVSSLIALLSTIYNFPAALRFQGCLEL